jgi:formylglycine-generating enzyme required for sulfatase activity
VQSESAPPTDKQSADGDERLAVAKAKVLAKELETEKDAERRREILGRLVEQTAALLKDPALRMQMLFLRGMAALELNNAELGWSTAKELRALKASESADDAGLEILAKLDLKGWNTVVKPTWYEVVAREVDAAVVSDAAARARMEQTKLPWKVRDRKTGIVMLLCPPGEFMMGSPANESGRDDDEAQQRVSITTAFYISETEVTQEQWQRTIGANPSNFKGASNPVEQVSWDDCQGFCAKTGLRLPSEAEWEYACRAGTTGAYAGDLDSMGWYGGNSRGPTHPVRQKRANPWGLYDMHGNVSEWCADGYLNRAAGMQTPVGARSFRVLRGGSWYSGADYVRSSHRDYGTPDYTSTGVGFRVARAPL